MTMPTTRRRMSGSPRGSAGSASGWIAGPSPRPASMGGPSWPSARDGPSDRGPSERDERRPERRGWGIRGSLRAQVPVPALPRERRSKAAPVDGRGGIPASREGTVRVRIAIVAALVLLLCGLGWTVLRVARLETAAVQGSPDVVDVAPRTSEPAHAAAPTPPPTLVSPSAVANDPSIAARLAAIEKRLDAIEKASEADRA